MSKEDVKKFIMRVGDDPELAEKVKAAGTDVAEVIRLGKEEGFEFTAQDMKAVHDESTQSGAELSDEDLEKVAGGFVAAVAAALGAVASVVGAAVAVGTAAVSVVSAARGKVQL